jgi:hypothetical protein
MAKGEGEYLYAFGTLLGVPSHQQLLFQQLIQMIQTYYPALSEIAFSHRDDPLNTFINQIQQAWDTLASRNL